jgi:MFS family permease
MTDVGRNTVRLGLRENLAQFVLLVAVNALVGGMVGQERTIVPLLGEAEFGLAAGAGMLSFIAVFGLTKAIVNYYAGTLADRYGRKPVLVAGWLIGIPVPLLLIWAPSWGWVVFANLLLGVNQGLTWSTTVIMKIDLVGPRLRGTAMGFNEAAGYGAVAVAACDRPRFFLVSPSPFSVLVFPRFWSGKRQTTSTSREPTTPTGRVVMRPTLRHVRCSPSLHGRIGHYRRPVRRGWSTT